MIRFLLLLSLVSLWGLLPSLALAQEEPTPTPTEFVVVVPSATPIPPTPTPHPDEALASVVALNRYSFVWSVFIGVMVVGLLLLMFYRIRV